MTEKIKHIQVIPMPDEIINSQGLSGTTAFVRPYIDKYVTKDRSQMQLTYFAKSFDICSK